MSIVLPNTPGPVQADISYLDKGGVVSSPLGGPDQRLNRLGNRFALAVTLPPLQSWGAARAWVAALVQAQTEGAYFEWPQPGLDIGSPGSPSVHGSGQAGSVLTIRDVPADYTFKVGQFISVVQVKRYVHMITAQVTGSGVMTIPIAPMLRVAFANGAPVEVGLPYIEGFLEGNSRDWTIDLAFNVGLSFRITEAE